MLKKKLCLILALTLLAFPLSGCRRRAKEEAPAEDAAPAAPGYVATDGSEVAEATNSVPDPLATPTPQELAAMEVGASDDGMEGELLPPGGDAASMAVPAATQQTTVIMGAYTESAGVNPQGAATAINPAAYQYSAVMDENVDYTFNYPSHWEHVPGIYTLCYREPVEKGDFPARISIVRKKLVHTPDDIAMMEQLTSYMKMVSERYDGATFQTSTPDKEARFMGHKALSNTYLAYWGDIEVKGYVVGVAIDRTLYVLHFCATYEDYAAMEGVMNYMVQSVQLREPEKKKK